MVGLNIILFIVTVVYFNYRICLLEEEIEKLKLLIKSDLIFKFKGDRAWKDR